MIGRAETDLEKFEILDRLEALWLKNPSLRLTQLIANVYRIENDVDMSRFYNTEDFAFIEGLELKYSVWGIQ